MENKSTNIDCNKEKDCEKQPLYFIRPFKESGSTWIWMTKLSKELRWLGRQSEAQKLFALIAVNLAGTVILLIWCHLTSSLALLAYTYLSWFNFLSLLTWLLCIWVNGQAASYKFTFGLIRCEMLAVFTSVTLTLLGSLFIIKESIERLIEPEIIYVDHLSGMAVTGFILNIVLTSLIQNPPLTHVLRCSPSSVLQEHFADISQNLMFHMPWLKRFLPSRINPLLLLSFVGFIFIVGNHIIVQIYKYSRCDTVMAFLIAAFTISTMYPLCIYSANILLQTIPSEYSAHLDRCLREVLTLDGVLEFYNEKFWVLGVGCRNNIRERSNTESVPGYWHGSVVAGSLHVRVRRDANEQTVLQQIKDKLNPLVPVLAVQVFKDDWTRNATSSKLLREYISSTGQPSNFTSPILPALNSFSNNVSLNHSTDQNPVQNNYIDAYSIGASNSYNAHNHLNSVTNNVETESLINYQYSKFRQKNLSNINEKLDCVPYQNSI